MPSPIARFAACSICLPLALTSIVFMAGTPASVHAQEPPAARPATKDSKMAAVEAFIAMINDGGEASVRAFESEHRSTHARPSVSVQERIKRVAGMKEEFGALTVEHVDSVEEGTIALTASSKTGQVVVMEFRFESGTDRIEGVTLSVGGDDVRPQALTVDMRGSTIEAACKALEEGYVFPDIAAKMAAKVRDKAKSGGYDAVANDAALARALTDDFRSVSHDLHLRVNVSPASPHAPAEGGHGGSDHEDQLARENYMFRKVEVLPGNIGYIRFDMFPQAEGANRAGSAAMAFVQDADAIIFDLRTNGGGSPEFIQYLTSYLFDSRTHLNDMVDRDGKVVEEYWTLDSVPGKRVRADVPIYILTSGYTFSGAEEFTYNLKNLKRATVVGETTGGGAHPVRGERLNDRFMIGVPFMRAQNPITKTNWEGKGIEPDIKTTADEALDKAVEAARKAIAAKGKK